MSPEAFDTASINSDFNYRHINPGSGRRLFCVILSGAWLVLLATADGVSPRERNTRTAPQARAPSPHRQAAVPADRLECLHLAIADLEEKREALARKMDDLGDSTGEAWDDVKDGFEKGWADLKESFREAKKKLDDGR